ncbi:MAG TPA: cytochrome c oxidase subunit II [Gammaproteobacteria bacterium]|nr:cytochrome c oxidase subunit II [Gammaproteobacteria bacterium]
MYSTSLSRLLAGALFAAIGTSAHAAFSDLNMPVGVTPISREAYELHMLILIICVVVGILVFAMMFISMLKHRKSLGHEPAQFHHSTKAEVTWTVIPCIILVAMAVPATNALISMEDTSEADMTIKVTGYQWKWKYEYLEDGITFYSNLAPSSRAAIYQDPKAVDHYLLSVDERVVLPAGKKVRLLITSDDVIHAWWVPALGMKKDAIPGFINQMWIRIDEDKSGVYRGQCAELCGKDHGFMPIVVEARSEEGYKMWVAERKAAMAAEKVAAGEADKSLAAVLDEHAAVATHTSDLVQPSTIAAAPSDTPGGL